MQTVNWNKKHHLFKVFLAMLLIVFISVWAIFTIDPSLLILDVTVTQANYSHTTLIVREGDVYVNGEKITQSRILEMWDIVTTGSDSRALIDFFDDSVTRLRENTNLEITELDVNPENQMETNILLKLNAGQLWNKVTKIVTQDSSFEVETYNTIAAVRGSAFDIKVDEETGATEVIVAEHAVDLKALDENNEVIGQTQVLEGYKTRVKKQIESDRDHDGLLDSEEVYYGTDPDNADTDGDGFVDGAEIQFGLNPNGEGDLDLTLIETNQTVEETSSGSVTVELTQNIFETRELLESEKDSEWMQDNLILDEQHEAQIEEEEKSYKQEVAGLLPDSPLYKLVTLKDQIVLSTSRDQSRKFLAELEIASRKMIEAGTLFEQGKEKTALELVEEFTNGIKSVGLELDQYDLTEEQIEKVKNKIGEVLDFHQKLLRNILPDSEMYDLKELMYELEIETSFDLTVKEVKTQEYKKQYATDILDLSKKTDDIVVLNEVLEDYEVIFTKTGKADSEEMHSSAKVTDALIASAEWMLVEKARAEVALSETEQAQKEESARLLALAEEKKLEAEESAREAEIQGQKAEVAAQKEAEAEAARIRAEKLANAIGTQEEAEEEFTEVETIEEVEEVEIVAQTSTETEEAQVAKEEAEQKAEQAQTESEEAEEQAMTIAEEVEQVVEAKRACTNSATDWEKSEWNTCSSEGIQTRTIEKISDCDQDATDSYIPPVEQSCDPCEDVELTSVCEGTTYKTEPMCDSSDGSVSYGTITENSEECGYEEPQEDCVGPDGSTIAHGESQDYYEASKIPYGEDCSDYMETRSCDDGVLSSSDYNYTATSCKARSNSGGGTTYYSCGGSYPSTGVEISTKDSTEIQDWSYGEDLTEACSWKCTTDYTYEEDACINTKNVECSDENLPENAYYTVTTAEINYTDADGWETAECAWTCNTNYEESDGQCVATTQTFVCDSDAKPANTVWNTAFSYTQTWNGTEWEPVDSTTSYNTTASETSCRYKCADTYEWNGESCEKITCTGTTPSGDGVILSTIDPTTNWDWTYSTTTTEACAWTCDTGYAQNGNTCSYITQTQEADCDGSLPENAIWNYGNDDSDEGKFTQTKTSAEGSWSPSSMDTAYNTMSGECRYVCNSGYSYANGECAYVTKTQEADCDGSLPENAIWNYGSDTSDEGEFTQTKTSAEGSWSPSSMDTAYNTMSGECRYVCNSGYSYANGECAYVTKTQEADCDGSLPENAVWNYGNDDSAEGEFTQTKTSAEGSWSPSSMDTAYNTTSGECRYVCASDYNYENGECVMEVPTSVASITFDSIVLGSSKITLDFDDTDSTESYEVAYENLENGSTGTKTFTTSSKQFSYVAWPILYKVRACNSGGCANNYSDSFVVVKGSSADEIQTAIENVSDSDVENEDDQKVVFVASGTYSGDDYIELESDVYLLGYSDDKPTIQTGILIDGEDNITIENLEIENESVDISNGIWNTPMESSNIGILVKGNTSSIVIKNNDFKIGNSVSNYPYAIFNKGATIDLIEGNEIISWATYVGIVNANGTINTISNNNINLTWEWSYGIYNYAKNWNAKIWNISWNSSIRAEEKGIRNNAYYPYISSIESFSWLENVTKCSGNQSGHYDTNGENWGRCY